MAARRAAGGIPGVLPAPPGKVLLLGATGGTGMWALSELLAHGYRVRCLVRDQGVASKLLGAHCKLARSAAEAKRRDEAKNGGGRQSDGPSIQMSVARGGGGGKPAYGRYEIVVGDLTNTDTLTPALEGVDRVVCCTGSRDLSSFAYLFGARSRTDSRAVDFEGVSNLVAAAERTGKIQQFVLVSSICVTRPWRVVALLLNSFLNMALKWKLEGERALRNSSLNYTIIRPGSLCDLPAAGRRVIVGSGDNLQGRIGRESVGQLCAAALYAGEENHRVTFECIWDNGIDHEDPNFRDLFESLEGDKGTVLPTGRGHTIAVTLFLTTLAFAVTAFFKWAIF